MFYNKEIEIYNLCSYEDEFGVTHEDGYKLVGSLMVDVQPYSSEKLKKDYGYDIECTKRIFMDFNKNMVESTLIKYRNEIFEVKKIIEWDDYLDIAIKELDKEVELSE